MGSFNSAPKINNIDCQDDGVPIPNGLSVSDFIYHCKMMRGENRPQLLTRSFLKAPAVSNLTSDLTDGLRFLNLDSVSHTCSAPHSPSDIRLLQWNILSQCKEFLDLPWCTLSNRKHSLLQLLDNITMALWVVHKRPWRGSAENTRFFRKSYKPIRMSFVFRRWIISSFFKACLVPLATRVSSSLSQTPHVCTSRRTMVRTVVLFSIVAPSSKC